MSDKIPLSRKAGSGLAKLLRGIFGRRNVEKARDSVEALKKEYRAGRDERQEDPPRTVPHRVVAEEEDEEGGRGPTGDPSPSPGRARRGPSGPSGPPSRG